MRGIIIGHRGLPDDMLGNNFTKKNVMNNDLNEIEILDVESEVYVIGADESDVMILENEDAYVVEMDGYVVDLTDMGEVADVISDDMANDLV